MALFVDGPACTIEELVDQDAGLLETAQTCGINLTTKVRLAAQDVENELQVWLDRPRSLIRRFSAGGIRIDQVVVTPPLRDWLTMHSLELVYRDGYFSQLVDRYQAKWMQYAKLAREARDGFVASGLGIVSDPMSLAVPPVLATVEGSQQGGTFYARVAWVNAAGQAGAASAASTITLGDGHLMTVLATDGPRNAIGFNVYAGWALDTLFQQNDVPVPTGTAFYFVPATAKRAGIMAGAGQAPDMMKPLPRSILRG